MKLVFGNQETVLNYFHSLRKLSHALKKSPRLDCRIEVLILTPTEQRFIPLNTKQLYSLIYINATILTQLLLEFFTQDCVLEHVTSSRSII